MHKRFGTAEKALAALLVVVAAGLVAFHVHLPGTRTAFLASPQESDAAATRAMEPVSSAEKVNVNTADIDTLLTLKGLRSDSAYYLIAERETNGYFRYPEDLLCVKGIGEKTLSKLRDYICFDLPDETQP